MIKKKKVAAKPATKKKVVTPIRLDLGGGQTPKEGFTNVDIFKGADIKHDLFTFPYPFKSNSVEEIHCSHFIEHIPMEYVMHNGRKKDMLFAFVDECERILVPGGRVYLIFPCATSTRAFQDPTHRRFIPGQTVYYFVKEWRDINKLDHYNVDCDFEWQVGEAVNANWASKADAAKAFAGSHYWNVVDDLHFILTKRK